MITNIFETEKNKKISDNKRLIKHNEIINKNIKQDKTKTLQPYTNDGPLKQYFTTQLNTINRESKTINDNFLKFPKYHIKPFAENNMCIVKQIELFDENKTYKIDANINTIYNVFKPTFSNGVKATGFGDFIRGCYFLLDFCRENKIKCNFKIVDHPIAKYLPYFKKDQIVPTNISKLDIINAINYTDASNNIIHYIDELKINNFIYFINNEQKYNNNVFINTFLFPRFPIKKIDSRIIRYILQPCKELFNIVNKKLNTIQLTKYNYSIIHVRMGDEYIKRNIPLNENKLLQKLFYLINLLPTDDYLLITDCIMLKQFIIDNHPLLNIKFILNNTTHTVDSFTEEGIINVLIDFYLMSYSKQIYSFSSYEHGSGFSKWCAITYDIPYNCKLLK